MSRPETWLLPVPLQFPLVAFLLEAPEVIAVNKTFRPMTSGSFIFVLYKLFMICCPLVIFPVFCYILIVSGWPDGNCTLSGFGHDAVGAPVSSP